MAAVVKDPKSPRRSHWLVLNFLLTFHVTRLTVWCLIYLTAVVSGSYSAPTRTCTHRPIPILVATVKIVHVYFSSLFQHSCKSGWFRIASITILCFLFLKQNRPKYLVASCQLLMDRRGICSPVGIRCSCRKKFVCPSPWINFLKQCSHKASH